VKGYVKTSICVMKTIFTIFLIFGLTHYSSSGQDKEFRVWTQSDSGRTLKAKMEWKRDNGEEARVMLENHKSIYLPVAKLAKEDQEFVSAWENVNVKLEANTVAMGANRTAWSAEWIAESKDTLDYMRAAEAVKTQDRLLGITIDNRGTKQSVVVDVFFFGFPLQDKNKRYVCARATKLLTAPGEVRYRVSCPTGYRYKESSLALVHVDFKKDVIAGLFVNSWSGYGYAGWAVRISDTNGKLLDQAASQPAILGNLKDVPFPTLAASKSDSKKK